ncbi:uncharacterized protein BP5553_10056 [Venustampulla echinocandica]|uniref:Uncharacterized protein n=1 Tax=Venustampulla echinocandica TaxID=2656787 RepID=A0A370TAA5_9HELO|nr:uncharacterized protein BP5553_10056 [Venustampulla echinocandica]RDL30711.1 hypothetical protein BP5553_10056 [Venustampulla echinocandica]
MSKSPYQTMSSSEPAPLSTDLMLPIPIHERFLVINPQTSSPFFSGLIPPEIRDAIFDYALTEYTRTDAESIYPVDTAYTRPGYTGKRSISISFLLTCRRIYKETYHLPATHKEHVFWHGRSPTVLVGDENERYYFRRFTEWQMKSIKEIHLFTQLFWLENSFPRLCAQECLQGMERMTITIRRGDWWWNESNTPLGIIPQRRHSDNAQMMKDWKDEKEGKQIPWDSKAWGSAFARLGSLKELVMELETSDDKKDELMAIVEKAKTWRFPYKNGTVLSAEGLREEVSTWQGPMCNWSGHCPYCGLRGKCKVVSPPNKGCEERTRLKAENKGPICYVVRLRWRVVKGGQ